MKATITRTVLTTLFLLLGLTFSSYAQTYYQLYLCDAGTAKLRTPQEPTLAVGDKVHWFVDGNPYGSPLEYNGTAGSTDITVPANLSVGLHNYTSSIESKDLCMGPLSDPFTVYKLPSKTIALNTPTNPKYCGDVTGLSSVITATATPGETLPDGVGYTFTWSATFNATAVPNITTIGTVTGNEPNINNTFTLNTTTAGTYVFNAKVVYTLLTGNTGTLRPTDGCEVSTTTSQTITVTPKPGKPTIELAP
jgi:plastocyanin